MSATGLLLETTVKTSIVILIALGAQSLLRRQSAALRHWILASAILGAAVIPCSDTWYDMEQKKMVTDNKNSDSRQYPTRFPMYCFMICAAFLPVGGRY